MGGPRGDGRGGRLAAGAGCRWFWCGSGEGLRGPGGAGGGGAGLRGQDFRSLNEKFEREEGA